MPIYEYQCRQCGHQFEKLVRGDATAECPACQAPEAERLFSMSAVISTQKTRSRSISVARKRAGSIKKEQDVAQREYERHIIEEHS